MGKRKSGWDLWNPRIRDTLLWGAGFCGLVNELFIQDGARPLNLVAVGSILGLPFVLPGGWIGKKEEDDSNQGQ